MSVGPTAREERSREGGGKRPRLVRRKVPAGVVPTPSHPVSSADLWRYPVSHLSPTPFPGLISPPVSLSSHHTPSLPADRPPTHLYSSFPSPPLSPPCAKTDLNSGQWHAGGLHHSPVSFAAVVMRSREDAAA